MKDKLIGVFVTMVSSAIMFLTYNLFGSFETKAGSESKYAALDRKLDQIICYLDHNKCLNNGNSK